MTNSAVTSISKDSGDWIGEVPTPKLGVWLDYAMLLVIVAYFIVGTSFFRLSAIFNLLLTKSVDNTLMEAGAIIRDGDRKRALILLLGLSP